MSQIDAMAKQLDEAYAEIARLRERNRKLRDVLTWTDDNCPGKCQGRIHEALIEDSNAARQLGGEMSAYSDAEWNEEVRELQAEIASLRASKDEWVKQAAEMEAQRDRLRAALEEIANSTWVAQTCPEAVQIARKALADEWE